MWNINKVEVNLFVHVDRRVGLDKSCIQQEIKYYKGCMGFYFLASRELLPLERQKR